MGTTTEESPGKPAAHMTLSKKIVIGLVAGIVCGVFFGEFCSALKIVGSAFVALMQMTVLPYIVLALIVNIGSLTLDTARHIAVRAAVVLVALWGLALVVILLLPVALPEWKAGGFFSTSQLQSPGTVDFVELYIPANPFYSLTQNLVPAVVLFCICLGVAMIGLSQKASVIEPMRVMLEAMSKVTVAVAQLTPYGVFAIAANASGTVTFAELDRLQSYMLIYLAATLILTFVTLPLAVTIFTPFSFRQILSASRGPLLTAFTANNYFIVLPMLIENIKELYREHDIGGEDTDRAIDITLPIAFPFPNVGRLLALIFIPFGAWYVGRPLELADYPRLVLAGLPSFFAKVTVAVPFLLDQFRLPADLFHLFLLSGILNGHLSSLAGAMHLFAFTAIAAAAVTGLTRFHPGRLLNCVMVTAVLLAAFGSATYTYVAWSLNRSPDGGEVITTMKSVTDYVPRSVSAVTGPNPTPLIEGQSTLERIRDRQAIRVGYLTDNLPFSYSNANGDLVGFDIEMAYRLAFDLRVDLELVPINHPKNVPGHLQADSCDIVMSGLPAFASSLTGVASTRPYLRLTPALVVPDYMRQEYDTVGELLDAEGLRIGIAGDRDADRIVRHHLPMAQIVDLPRVAAFFEAESPPADVLFISAEAGSAWTLIHPDFEVVLPFSANAHWSVAYMTAVNDPEFLRFLDLWIDLVRNEGAISRLHDHWMLGKTAVSPTKRWSVIRNVLHWVD